MLTTALNLDTGGRARAAGQGSGPGRQARSRHELGRRRQPKQPVTLPSGAQLFGLLSYTLDLLSVVLSSL